MANFVAVFVFLFVVLSVVAQSDAACQAGGCSKTEIHDSYSINPDNDCTTNGTSNVTATCSTNSTITYPLACNNGAWNATLNESCAMTPMTAMCPDLVVENGNTINGAAINSTATVTCSSGYQLSEDSSVTITCTMDGSWSPTPECESAMCPGLNVENGNTINGAAINSTAMVTCSDGYQLSEDSSATITCTMGGSWSPTPECESGTIRFVALYCVTFLAVTIAVLMSHQ